MDKFFVNIFVILSACGGALCNVPFFIKNMYQTSENINVNTSIDPCINFYEYSCSKWISQTKKSNFDPFLSQFTAASYEINKNIQNILENSPSDQFLEKPFTFYNACIDTTSRDDTYFTDLKLLIEFFKGWPLGTKKWSNDDFYWLEDVVQVTKILGVHPILKFHVAIDYKDTTKHSIYIEPGTLVFPHGILLHSEKYPTEISAYIQWILKTVQHLYPQKSIPKSLKLKVLKMIDFEIELAKLRPSISKIEKFSIEKLTKKTSIDFDKYLGNLFSDTDVEVNKSISVIIKNYGYFRNVVQYLKKVDTKTIANYIIWSVVKDLSRDSTKYLRDLNFSIDKTIFKITSDTPRNIECVSKTMDYFSYFLLPKYLEKYFANKALENVKTIASNIKAEYEVLLKKNKWLSEETRNLAIEKVKNIQFFIGYNDALKQREIIKEMYKNVKISDDHLQNLLTLKNFRTEQNFKLLDDKVSAGVWPCNIYDVNAYYSVLQNSVFVPLGLIQKPFYYENRPSVENYGSIGSLLGHEMSHSLDTTGRQANLQGIISKWWPNQDITDYQSKTKCFEDLYQSQNVFNMGENIADIVGLDISYKAFANSDLEYLLSNREKLDKMFYISYAQIWCEKSYDSDIFNDEHTTVQNRVNNVVYNSQNFRNTFNCTDLPSNEICELW